MVEHRGFRAGRPSPIPLTLSAPAGRLGGAGGRGAEGLRGHGPAGGGGGHAKLACRLDGVLSAAAGAHWPLATCPCPSLEPSPSAGGGAHRPLTAECPPSPSAWPVLTLLLPPSISLGEAAPTDPQDCPCSTARRRIAGGGGVPEAVHGHDPVRQVFWCVGVGGCSGITTASEPDHNRTRQDPGGVFAQRAHSANYYGDYPGNSPENQPPAE